MSLRLVVGTLRLSDYIYREDNTFHASVRDGDQELARCEQSEIWQPELGPFAAFKEQITEVQVAYTRCPDLEFLRFVPGVEEVWLQPPDIGNVDGLRYLPQLRRLAMDRPRYRFDVLKDLQSLESIYLDAWRPGAAGVFQLTGLKKLWVQKYPYTDLKLLQSLHQLENLWLNAGRLASLEGIPSTLQHLRLTTQTRLESLAGLERCSSLVDLELQGCRRVTSLAGVEGCPALDFVSISRSGPLTSLEPLRHLPHLRRVVLIEGTVNEQTDAVDALYGHPTLEKLIISRKSGLDPDIVKQSAPNCEVRLARRG